jgi:hypothetical protein
MKQLIGSYIKISAQLQSQSPSVYRLCQSLLYGSHPSMFITEQTTLIQSHTAQVYFNSVVTLTFKLHVLACTLAILGHVNTKTIHRKILYSPLYVFVLTSLRMAKVQSITCRIHVRVTTGIKIILCCVRLNKCDLLVQSLLGNYIVNIKQAAVT